MGKSFEITILGATGGPLDGNTQSFMVRPYSSKELYSICVDGGVGFRQIIELVREMRKVLSDDIKGNSGKKSDLIDVVESFYENEFELSHLFHDPSHDVKKGFGTGFMNALVSKYNLNCNTIGKIKIMQLSLYVYDFIQEYFITHAHLDHISAMVINTPYAYCENHLTQKRKKIYGLPFTTDVLKKHIFNELVWPDLTVEDKGIIDLVTLKENEFFQVSTIPQFEIRSFSVRHGTAVTDNDTSILSTVFIVKDKPSRKCVVICGDLESDLRSGPKNNIKTIWEYLVENVRPDLLAGILIECSSISEIEESHLYGHLSPPFLIEELKTLNNMYCKKYNIPMGSINDLLTINLIVTHIKMETMEKDPRLIILKELKDCARTHKMTNLSVSIAVQGYTYCL